MLEAGADILDIGGHSTRPGAETVPASEERDRLLPAVEAVRRAFPEALISLDTYRASVAAPALEAGGGLVNDVTGGEADPALPALAASRRVPYLLMHRQGTFKTMQQAPTYEDVVLEVFDYLNHRVDALRRMGVYDLAIDPGFGFGKSVAHNYQLLRHLGYFRSIGLPVLVGLSRKSMINKVLGIRASEALHGTIALQTVALMQGASLLRVHDVRPAVQTIQLLNHLYETV
jgi:dihydropteroate synthase